MMNSKVGRNEKCPCGSGKKFKKCCIVNEFQKKSEVQMSIYEEMTKTKSRIVSNDSIFVTCRQIPFVKNINSLPKKKSEEILKYLKEFPPKMGQCYYNSSLTSFNVKDVNIVYGYFSIPLKSNPFFQGLVNLDFETCLYKLNQIPFLFNIVNLNNEFIEVSHNLKGGGKFYIEPKKNIFWSGHCWNEYDGKYFDVTVEKNRLEDRFPFWIQYKKGITKFPHQIFNSTIPKELYNVGIYNCI